MQVTYRDELGVVTIAVDEYGVSFDTAPDGGIWASFSDGKYNYGIPVVNLISII